MLMLMMMIIIKMETFYSNSVQTTNEILRNLSWSLLQNLGLSRQGHRVQMNQSPLSCQNSIPCIEQVVTVGFCAFASNHTVKSIVTSFLLFCFSLYGVREWNVFWQGTHNQGK